MRCARVIEPECQLNFGLPVHAVVAIAIVFAIVSLSVQPAMACGYRLGLWCSGAFRSRRRDRLYH